MVRSTVVMLLLAVAAGACAGQESRGGSAAVDVLLQTPLDASHNHAGDAVIANVLADMKAADGRVIIPRGSVVSGSIVSATPKASAGKESSIEISFDHLKFADGTQFPISATVQAVLVNAPRDNDTPTVGLGAPTRAMSGTNAGGVTSQIASGDRDKGAVIAETAENYQIGKAMPQNAAGVHGVKNVSLKTHAGASVISSAKSDVKVPSGSQLLLVIRNR